MTAIKTSSYKYAGSSYVPVLRLARETEALGNLPMLFASTSED